MIKKNKVPIIFSSDNNYVAYLSVIMASVIENSSSENEYEFIVLETSISEENKKILSLQIKDQTNFSLRFLNLSSLVNSGDFHVEKWFTVETYFRLYVPSLLSEYDKAIYLDVDMIVLDDVAKLYDIELEDYSLAATINFGTVRLFHEEPEWKDYFDNTLKLTDPYTYFQAGVLVLNLAKMRENNEEEQLMKLTLESQFWFVDQDSLNSFYQGNIKFIDQTWDLEHWLALRDDEYLDDHFKMNKDMLTVFNNAKENPKIIHYAGSEKPWAALDMNLSKPWWKYVNQTPYINDILINKLAAQNAICTKQGQELRSLVNQHNCLWLEHKELENNFSKLSNEVNCLLSWRESLFSFRLKRFIRDKVIFKLLGQKGGEWLLSKLRF